MSSILKALEKVDESQRTRRPAGTGGLPKGRGRRPAWLIPVWTLGGAGIAALATYAVMGGFSRPAAQVTPKGADVVATATPVSAAPADVPPQQAVKGAVPAQPVAAPAAAAAKPVQAATPKVAAKTLPVAVPVVKPTVQPVAKPVTQSAAKAASGAQPQLSAKVAAKQLAQPVAVAAKVPAAVVQPAPAVAASAPAAVQPVQQKSRAIRVTGIAWQNSSESSFAMVNGQPMRQGNSVEGYKIEQIYEDSVRFSNSKGNTLVVPLGAGEE
ncbi:hypothetical protein [Geomonas subterranea]|uniref:Uncharacterized protein n=1 Tax=Geomonas subterranea TaxID=2847989 RepID=A0ABX8LLJ4_9BACT|nr:MULTISPECIES: hypothetical protein [Geomonas]QXE91570.1 hypothetical protein KP001_03210 [Geomonas subterranea]QXM10341.1 hypothetical protein KP002_04285 [Geomonas subterranea]